MVDGARPLVADLRPLLANARPALADTVAWSHRLDPVTGNVVGHLPDLAAFIYQGNSVFQLEDANGPILRGLVDRRGGDDPVCAIVPCPSTSTP